MANKSPLEQGWKIDQEKLRGLLSEAFWTLLGPGAMSEDMRGTAERVTAMWMTFVQRPSFKFTTFPNEDNYDQMIILNGITFSSMCAHHFMPFFGTATVGYIPGTLIAGVSKLARTVDLMARDFTNQERLTQRIADMIWGELSPIGMGVVLEAQHTCMVARGVSKPGAYMVTNAFKGVLLDDSTKGAAARAEFLASTR
jgi:GTP cyclohydrolase I